MGRERGPKWAKVCVQREWPRAMSAHLGTPGYQCHTGWGGCSLEQGGRDGAQGAERGGGEDEWEGEAVGGGGREACCAAWECNWGGRSRHVSVVLLHRGQANAGFDRGMRAPGGACGFRPHETCAHWDGGGGGVSPITRSKQLAQGILTLRACKAGTPVRVQGRCRCTASTWGSTTGEGADCSASQG